MKLLNSPGAGDPKPPVCPKDLSTAAKKKWREVAKMLAHDGILGHTDLDILAMYCTSFTRWQEAEAVLAKKGLTVKGEFGESQSPYLAIANRAHEQCRKLGKQLGLEPSSWRKLRRKQSGGIMTRDRSQGPKPPGKNT